jgi:xanthine dehydrogenase iron-sulfur cluster and FAD-binding subunit A
MCQETTKAYPMTNTHILFHTFEYVEPASLQEAVALLRQHGSDAQLLAGGTYVLVQMKQERKAPKTLINIRNLPELTGTAWEEGALSIGALTTIRETHNLADVQSRYQALAQACGAFGSMQIQMMGTLGGNVCNGSPASDAVPALMAFDAQLALLGPEGERTVPLQDFLLGPGRVALREGEVLARILLTEPRSGTGSAFIKISRVQADLAKVSAAAVIVRDGDGMVECRISLGSVAPTVIRVHKAEAFLKGKKLTSEVALQAGTIAMDEALPIDDVRATAWYRREVIKAIVHDVLLAAWERAGQDGAPERVETPAPLVISHNGRSMLRVKPDERHPVDLVVNGQKQRVWVAPNELLLNVLRDRLELTGSKYGCGIGECGACTILLNGRPALGCLTLALAADGCEVTTVEGLQGPDGSLHPLQEAFLEQQAFQCGYCTPGMLMMTKALLDEIAAPGEEDVREYLRGNRCRCTGFLSIVRAVQSCVEPAA